MLKEIIIDSEGRRRTAVRKSCEVCGNEFLVQTRHAEKQKRCSRECSDKDRQKQVTVKCGYCGSAVQKTKSKLRNSKHGLFFCDRKCKEAAQRIGGLEKLQLPHYGQNNARNYRDFAKRELPLECNRCGYNEHPKILQVHHIDRNRSNGDLSNLEILCPNCHAFEHWG